tara:strand:+ start:8322 stop:9110 length:789 start_codon:yes stop_codon:yes gene_type:complete
MAKRSHGSLKAFLITLFHRRSRKSILFNRILIFLNIAVFGIFALEYLFPGHSAVRTLELIFGVLFLIEYAARLWITPRRLPFLTDPFSIIDVLVIISLFAPLLVGNLALLRILRSLKVLRTYYILQLLKKESKAVAQYRATLVSILNFLVFLAIMTAIVFVAESQFNPYINTYLDALYFTVSTLTTTGYGDVTATGPWGKLLSVAAMLIGITLFLQLTRTIFRGAKIHYTCTECGLSAHDVDSTHCKHCGHIIKHKHFSYNI